MTEPDDADHMDHYVDSVDDEEPVELIEDDEPFPEPEWVAPLDAGDPQGVQFIVNEETSLWLP